MKIPSLFARRMALVFQGALTVCILILVVVGCQRNVKDIPAKESKQEVPADLMSLIKKQGSSIYIPINKPVPGILLDKNGNEIATHPHSGRLDGTPDEICDDPASATVGPNTLIGVNNQILNCTTVEHTLTVYWQVRSSFDLVAANPNPSYQASRGRLRIKNGSTITYSDLNINLTSGNIVYVGVDPIDPTVKIYNITYVKSGIPHTYLSAGNFTAVEVSLSIYSDCTDPYDSYLITTPYTAAFSPTVGLDPCERIDGVYINPATSMPPSADYCASIAGSYVTGSPGLCQNYTANLGSEVQVKLAGDPDVNYRDIQTKAAGDPTYRTSGYVYNWEVLFIRQFQSYVPNAGSLTFPANFTFRWRNFHGTGVGSITCLGNQWSTPVTLSIYDF
jgi:hypothetical protein